MKIYQFQLLFYIMWEGRYRTISLMIVTNRREDWRLTATCILEYSPWRLILTIFELVDDSLSIVTSHERSLGARVRCD